MALKDLRDALRSSLKETQTYSPDEDSLWREVAEEIKSELRTAYGDDVIEVSRPQYEWSFHAVWQGLPQGPGRFNVSDIVKIIESVVWIVTGEKPETAIRRNGFGVVYNSMLRVEVTVRDTLGRRVDIEMMDAMPVW